jgi:hypothetical protein
MAGQKSKRHSRKRRNPGGTTQVTRSQRRELRAERQARPVLTQRAAGATGTVGERPAGPFGGLPVSEILIFAGLIGLIVGLIQGGPALIVGIVVIAAGVLEVTVREHFSGFRSHATFLSAIPAVAVEIALVVIFGEPRQRALLVLPVVPVFAIAFWLLRKRFRIARQARLARPPTPHGAH